MNEQLALDIQLNQEATLSNFNWQGNEVLHQQLLHSLSDTSNERLFYLWGNNGFGKSHLLQACCHFLSEHSSIYFPLQQFRDYGPMALDGLEQNAVICIDDIDCIADDKAWEEAIFHLYNRVRDAGSSYLLISGNTSPTTLPIVLPDLRSRLAWGLVFQINELPEEGKIQTLQIKAQERGFELSDSACQYLIKRCSRNMHDLLEILQQLDRASLAAKRKITIPFIKNTILI